MLTTVCLVLVLTLSTAATVCRASDHPPSSASLSEALKSAVIPLDGSGEAVLLITFGHGQPLDEGVLLFTSGRESRVVPVVGVSSVRWSRSAELILAQTEKPRGGGWDHLSVRCDRDGRVIERQTMPGLITAGRSRDGRLLAMSVVRDGVRQVEIHELTSGMPLVEAHPLGDDTRTMDQLAWSPDGSTLAVTRFVRSERPGRFVARIGLLPRATGDVVMMAEGPAGDADRGLHTVALAWTEKGIFASRWSNLIRCDPSGSGCVDVYNPGADRAVMDCREAGSGRLLVSVQDLTIDALDVRSNELHDVDLATGNSRILLRLPEGAFLQDFDWMVGAKAR